MKKNTMIISVMLLSLAATIAVGKDKDRDDDDRGCRGHDDDRCVAAVAAPEIDLAQGLNALVLLAGAVAIFRASRVRKNPA
jgi:hypothetical protein